MVSAQVWLGWPDAAGGVQPGKSISLVAGQPKSTSI
jgi:hypothetical protein